MRRLMLLLAAAAMFPATPTAHADLGDQLFKLLPDDAWGSDQFGGSVAISGDIAIVGADKDDENGSGSGSAYLFDTTTGTQIAELLPDDGAAGDFFGASVGISGTTAIIGARQNDDLGANSGAAYLFDTTTGSQLAKLLPNDGAENDKFGSSVAISGTTAIVGALGDDDNGLNSGSAYLFDVTTGLQIAKLLPDDGASYDTFGGSVAISGATAIVGAAGDDDNGNASGSAYLFDTTTGSQIAKLLPGDGEWQDLFGGSVAISGAAAIVGAAWDDAACSFLPDCNSGSAYLFDTTTGQQIAKLLPDDGAYHDRFGASVAISGTTAIVGTWGDDDNGSSSGSAYLFDAATGQQIAKLLPDDGAAGDHFGWSVAINGTTAIAGALFDDDGGSAYLFCDSSACDDDNPCTDDSCDPDSGCVHTPNTELCDDGNACTEGDVCSGGACGGSQVTCDDDNVCTNDSCDPANGCVFAPNSDSCDDGDTCTENDVCTDGACGGSEVTCDDDNACTDDSCDPASGCMFTPNSHPCNDGNACTDGDACSEGTCGGSEVTCDDSNACTDDACDPANGCMFTPNSDSCDDSDACTVNDICSEGTCGGSEVTCDDDDACTDDSCDPLAGCEFAVNFDEVSECCDPATGNTILIDDGDACTEDACDPSTGAVAHSPACLDIRPGSCPNPFNRGSNGVLPVTLIGSTNFDAQDVVLSSLQLSRADGIGGSAAPNEGPPGPHSVLDDVATPLDGEGCECHDLGGDGIADLLMKFKTQEVVAALQLDGLLGGELISLRLTGNLVDGTSINAEDCIWLVPPGDIEPANAAVDSNEIGAFVEAAPLDLNFDSDGFTGFARAYVPGTVVSLTAEPTSPDGYPFLRWVVDGVPQPIGLVTIEVTITDDMTLRTLFDLPCEWDLDGDDAVGASDLAQLLASWGPCPGCAQDFNDDGEVGAFDLAQLLGVWGPCP